ncbi:Non-functional NADPH-dependent codeinone reductase 2-like [Orobanche gracilis]
MGIPEVELNSGYRMPVLGLGTASYTTPRADEVQAILNAIERGYRHFDTAAQYGSEAAIGEAIAEALRRGLIKSRQELFIVSKLWVNDTHAHRVLPALQKSLQNLNLEYLDLYLIHWPISTSITQENNEYPVSNKKNIIPFDCNSVWSKMEEAVKSGLVKSIGVSNFTCKKIDDLLSFATIPPAVNQVELSPLWQQKKLIDFCKSKGIVVAGYSMLGSAGQFWGSDRVVGIEALKEIAIAKGKSVPQVILRWAHQLGAVPIVKSFNPGRMEENRNIFDWELSEEEVAKITEIPQSRGMLGEGFVGEEGAIKSVEDLWDGEL